MSYEEEALEQIQDTLSGSQNELGKVAGEWEVWASLLRQLPL